MVLLSLSTNKKYMNRNTTFQIQSKYLKIIEPMLKEHFNYSSIMLMDDICQCLIEHDDNYKQQIDFWEDELFRIDFHSLFIEDDSLYFTNTNYITKTRKTHSPRTYLDIAKAFPTLFSDVKEIKDGEEVSEHTKICLCLSYMEYIYHKYTHDYFNTSPNSKHNRKQYTYDYYYQYCILLGLDTRYYKYGTMYSEMLLLYKSILESKNNKIKLVEIRNEKGRQQINSYGWLYNDMENVLKQRFPNLTLDKCNELLRKDNKAGRKTRELYLLIWGAYYLLKNHHSSYKSSKTKVISDLCKFALEYIEFLGFYTVLIPENIIDYLKKTKTAPNWIFPWSGNPSYSSIEEYIEQEYITIK